MFWRIPLSRCPVIAESSSIWSSPRYRDHAKVGMVPRPPYPYRSGTRPRYQLSGHVQADEKRLHEV